MRNYRRIVACFLGGLALLVALAVGCGPSQVTESNPPSEVELAVGMPNAASDPGTVPDAESMKPPAIVVGAEPPTNLTLSDASTSNIKPPNVPKEPDAAKESVSETVAAKSEDSVGLAGGTGPEDWKTWDEPQAMLVISGQQHGYIEPCGCTGLANQKGGLMRRATLVQSIRDRGWEVIPVDAGNQIRRSGMQAEIKFQTSVKGLEQMGYQAVGFGPDDLRVGSSELVRLAADDGTGTIPFVTANVEMLAPDLIAPFKKLTIGDRVIGITTALDPQTIKAKVDDAIVVGDLKEKLLLVSKRMDDAGCNFKVLLLFGDSESAKQAAKDVPEFDLVVAGATVGEPKYQAEAIDGTNSRLVMTGDKGMYIGLVGIYEDQPFKYARVALTDEFEDSREIMDLMAAYQNQLMRLGLDGLKIEPLPHRSGREFVGSQKCGECHTTAYDIWEGTPHFEATEHIVHPGERSEIARHHDPECLSCHVTGWNPQEYYPYTSGYLSLEGSPLLHGNGCENCHGPGKSHAEAEEGGDYTDEQIAELREGVRLTLDRAREKCLECHDLDNSPDFHKEGAFEEYWMQVEHYGVD